jgi:hypothetical protein
MIGDGVGAAGTFEKGEVVGDESEDEEDRARRPEISLPARR